MSPAETSMSARVHSKPAGVVAVCQGLRVELRRLVQGPNGVIPSFVWLERPEDGDDLIGHVLTDFSPANQVIEIREAVCDGELGSLEARVAGDLGGGVSGLGRTGSDPPQSQRR